MYYLHITPKLQTDITSKCNFNNLQITVFPLVRKEI